MSEKKKPREFWISLYHDGNPIILPGNTSKEILGETYLRTQTPLLKVREIMPESVVPSAKNYLKSDKRFSILTAELTEANNKIQGLESLVEQMSQALSKAKVYMNKGFNEIQFTNFMKEVEAIERGKK